MYDQHSIFKTCYASIRHIIISLKLPNVLLLLLQFKKKSMEL